MLCRLVPCSQPGVTSPRAVGAGQPSALHFHLYRGRWADDSALALSARGVAAREVMARVTLHGTTYSFSLLLSLLLNSDPPASPE